MSAKEGDIFEAHLLMLEDRVLIDEVIRFIRDKKVNADYAFHTVAERYVAALAGWMTIICANAPPTCAT
jgi:phosphotransferase system enzyme I (PtsI)